ncbi:MAG: iron ABC transporter permease [Deltaproteobacteria bacterium]|nr:iron ABC transporter permease [Deltaproteobacteria bacterium]
MPHIAKNSLLFPMLGLLVLVSFSLNVSFGSVSIPFDQITDILQNGPDHHWSGQIVWNMRLPRAMASIIGGAMLAVAGLLLQAYFRNPIVGPFVLGVSSGASLMVALVTLTTLSLGFAHVNPYISGIAALAGALGIMVLVIAIAAKIKSPVILLIIGLMIGYITRSVTGAVIAFAEAERLRGFLLWQMGSFAGITWEELKIMSIGGVLLLSGAFTISKPLNAFLLGEDYASTMGVNVKRFRLLVVFLSCALASLVTATAGPVSFIGLAVPHMARLLMNTSNHRLLIPASALLGAIITGVCDLIARMVFSPVETPISGVTCLFGAPIVISLLLKKRTAS